MAGSKHVGAHLQCLCDRGYRIGQVDQFTGQRTSEGSESRDYSDSHDRQQKQIFDEHRTLLIFLKATEPFPSLLNSRMHLIPASSVQFACCDERRVSAPSLRKVDVRVSIAEGGPEKAWENPAQGGMMCGLCGCYRSAPNTYVLSHAPQRKKKPSAHCALGLIDVSLYFPEGNY